jgi:hypothetical protein
MQVGVDRASPMADRVHGRWTSSLGVGARALPLGGSLAWERVGGARPRHRLGLTRATSSLGEAAREPAMGRYLGLAGVGRSRPTSVRHQHICRTRRCSTRQKGTSACQVMSPSRTNGRSLVGHGMAT